MRWVFTEWDSDAAKAVTKELGVSPQLADLLVQRGYTDIEDARRFLSPRLSEIPDPSTMADMDRAANRVADALVKGETIAIYGDYDVDGVTSSALLHRFLGGLGASVSVFIPDRFVDGYGLNAKRVQELVDESLAVLITVDCGTSNPKEVAIAQDAGCDVIVVDHHKIPEKPAEPFALLNPVRSDCDFPNPRIAAVTVAFFLCIAIRRVLRERGVFGDENPEPDVRALLELVALGTVADVMPLSGLNRVMVSQGLKAINRQPSLGMDALSIASGIEDRPVRSSDLGFRFGPRINAAGRMTHARGGFDLLTVSDADTARNLARNLNQENQSRRDTERAVLDEAMEMAQQYAADMPYSLVLYSPGWHLGVVGIVAARIREAFHRPTFILGQHPTDGCAKGSGRSISGFDLVEGLRHSADHLTQFGGHAHAAGVTLDADSVDGFWAALEAHARSILHEDDLVGEVRIDKELDPSQVNLSFWEEIETMAPFGAGNPRPVFAFRNVSIASHRAVGDGSHLALQLEMGGQRLRGIAFGMADKAPLLSEPVDLAVQITENNFRGRRSAEFQVKSIRPAGSD